MLYEVITGFQLQGAVGKDQTSSSKGIELPLLLRYSTAPQYWAPFAFFKKKGDFLPEGIPIIEKFYTPAIPSYNFV